MMRGQLFYTLLIASFTITATTARAANKSELQKKGNLSEPSSSLMVCFGADRCFELESNENHFHAVEKFKDAPYKTTEIDNATFDSIKKGVSDFETWAKKATAGSKNILGCRHEFSATEGKSTRTICLDNIDDKEKTQKSKALISLFTQAKPIAKSSSAPIPDCSPASKTDSGMCTVDEAPHAPTKKSK